MTLSDTRPIPGALPCPFCGSREIHNWRSLEHGAGSAWSAMCFTCECEGPHHYTEQAAIEAWNKRAWMIDGQ